jgi:pimeloyl-ACP methyl ester carboxylesterase
VREKELSDTPVVYHEYGAGPPVVIVHGLNSYAHDWAPVAEGLAARGRRVLIPYRRGRKPSGPLGAGYTLATEVADLSALLDLAGPGATLVGHSFGGLVALLTAGARPELGALFLYDPPLPGFIRDRTPGLAAMRVALDAGDPETALEVMVTDIDEDQPDRVADLRKDPLWPTLVAGVATAHTELTALMSTPAPDLSTYPPVRTTVLVGELSKPKFGPGARAIVAGLPDARLIMLKGQGHLAHSADPAQLVELIDAA